MEAGTVPYPASLSIDYPEKGNRLTTFFRLIVILPILIIVYLVAKSLTLPIVLTMLFRKKYPRWWFDWNLNLTRFGFRIYAYILLLAHVYPSLDEHQGVHLDLSPPDGSQLSRGLPLVKWFLAIPHYVVLYILGIGVAVVTFLSWFAILFTGRYPRSFFDFVVGVMRWALRVDAYAFLLTTDRYPPFSLSA